MIDCSETNNYQQLHNNIRQLLLIDSLGSQKWGLRYRIQLFSIYHHVVKKGTSISPPSLKHLEISHKTWWILMNKTTSAATKKARLEIGQVGMVNRNCSKAVNPSSWSSGAVNSSSWSKWNCEIQKFGANWLFQLIGSIDYSNIFQLFVPTGCSNWLCQLVSILCFQEFLYDATVFCDSHGRDPS